MKKFLSIGISFIPVTTSFGGECNRCMSPDKSQLRSCSDKFFAPAVKEMLGGSRQMMVDARSHVSLLPKKRLK